MGKGREMRRVMEGGEENRTERVLLWDGKGRRKGRGEERKGKG